jgi:hypothetical protein
MNAVLLEQPFDTLDTLRHIGRNDVRGTYWDGDYAESASKQQERWRVADFILRSIPAGQRIALLSLPGRFWAFENLLIGKRPGTHVVGLEQSITTFLHSRRNMPGSNIERKEYWPLSDRQLVYGNSSYAYARISANRRTGKQFSSHRLLQIRSSVYASMLVTDYGQRIDQRNAFYRRFCHRNAVWLDYTSPLCGEVEETLRYLPLSLERNAALKPVVITILGARDHFCGSENRIARIQRIQPAIKYASHWTYAGKGSAPMLTICGYIQ